MLRVTILYNVIYHIVENSNVPWYFSHREKSYSMLPVTILYNVIYHIVEYSNVPWYFSHREKSYFSQIIFLSLRDFLATN